MKHIKCRHQEDDDEEPFNESAEEFAGGELESGAREHAVNSGLLQGLVNAERVDDLCHDAAETSADNPANDEDDNGNDEIGDERDQPIEEILEGLIQHICPRGENHIWSNACYEAIKYPLPSSSINSTKF